ncbi:MAG TPA: hypothetical protein ENH65_06685, partial [Candidatus Aminicenantes bacterium]|nr:hypothetical protein [Candidatus Aminicenantes bacterium]
MRKYKKYYFIHGFITFFFGVYLCSSGLAQEKNLKKITYEQAYLDAKPHILKPAPRRPTSRSPIRAWLDEEHYLLSERDEKEESTKLYKVNAKSGKKTVFIDYDQIQKTFPKGLKADQH